jgi:hypothetical protein
MVSPRAKAPKNKAASLSKLADGLLESSRMKGCEIFI